MKKINSDKIWAYFIVIMMFTFFLLVSSMNLIFAQDKVKFVAAGVTCSMCSSAIHKSLHSDKNILKIEPNLQTQEWNVEYKEGTYTFDKLKKSVESAGFSIDRVWLNGELVIDNRKKKTKNNSK